MVITLIGLSGSGKSHLAQRMAEEKGFTLRSVDNLIIEKLQQRSEISEDTDLEQVANWLGQPDSPHFREREALYLELEKEVTDEIIAELGDDGWGLSGDLVIDTTGSSIYLGEKYMKALAKRSRVIYLAIPESEYQFMFQQYFEDPKPVIWGDFYQPKQGETSEQTLQRCYPELIHWRAIQYKKYSDMFLVMDRENRDRMSVGRFLRLAGAQ